MTARVMARYRRTPTPHTDWCARDHRCTLAEHRSADIIADHLGARAVITRVRAGHVEYAEIRARIPLAEHPDVARRQLDTALHLTRRLFAIVAAVRAAAVPERPGVARPDDRRAALDHRAALGHRAGTLPGPRPDRRSPGHRSL